MTYYYMGKEYDELEANELVDEKLDDDFVDDTELCYKLLDWAKEQPGFAEKFGKVFEELRRDTFRHLFLED